MQFTFKREAIVMTGLYTVPMVLGLSVYSATILFPRLAASSVTVSDLNILKAGKEVGRLFAEEANRDAAMGAFWNQGRKRFWEALKDQPFVSAERGTYLRDVRKSAVRCDDDPSSSRTFRLVEVVNGPNRGTLGWTCGPTKAIAKGYLSRLP